jgi:hypothetical protein
VPGASPVLVRRGRPPVEDEPVSRLVKVYVTERQARMLERMADLNQQSRAAFVRAAIADAISDCSDERFRRKPH